MLQRIEANPSRPSANAMLALLKKLAAIEATGVLNVGLSWLNSNYQRALFHQVRKSSAHRVREIVPPRRHAALVCFLWQSYRDTVDQAVDMFDKLLTRTSTHAQHDIDEQLCRQRQTIQTSLATLKSMGRIILDESIADSALRPSLFAEIPREDLAAQLEAVTEWVMGKKSDLFHGIVRRFGTLRKFSPTLLQALEFLPDAEGDPWLVTTRTRPLRCRGSGTSD